MGDGRPGGIEKIAHLFLAAGDTLSLRDGNGLAKKQASQSTPGAGPGAAGSTGTGSVMPMDSAAEVGSYAMLSAGFGDSAGPRDSLARDLAKVDACVATANVVAVLSGHLGPRAGPAAEACARLYAKRGLRVAMLYGPAEHACLHRFVARSDETATSFGDNGQPQRFYGGTSAPGRYQPCDLLLLPDWVFQYDLWPAGRPVASVCVAYAAGSQGLMAAYGALKGFIARFSKPQNLSAFAFGCDPQEAEWGWGRFAEMCRRFLTLEPRSFEPRGSDVPVEAGELLALGDGLEGLKRLLASAGAVSALRQSETSTTTQSPDQPQACDGMLSDNVDNATLSRSDMPKAEALMPVARPPAEALDVLQALMGHLQVGSDQITELWRRDGLAGAVCGRTGLVAGVVKQCDVLGFALWLYRRSKLAGAAEPASVTIALRNIEDWLFEAAEVMPVPVKWLHWQAFELAGKIGLYFEPIEAVR